MPEGRHLGLFSSAGQLQGSVLVDGFVRAMWHPRTEKGATLIRVTPFAKPLPAGDRAAISDEARELLDMVAPGQKHDVAFGPVKD